MSHKKCPKCGVDNPTEVVMCWSCYTPLSGAGATNAGAVTASAPGSATHDTATLDSTTEAEEVEKRPVSPALVGVLATVVLVAVGIGLKTASPPSQELPPLNNNSDNTARPPGNVRPKATVVPGGVSVTVPPPAAVPFQPVVLPNPRVEWGTMGIVPTRPDLRPTQAAALAAFTVRQYSKAQMQQWNRFYIFVFKDQATGRTFSAYMNERNGAPLRRNDYEALSDLGVWNQTLVRYEYRNQNEKVLYPQANPAAWWLDKSAGAV